MSGELVCRILGHRWRYTCIGTWGNDDRWECQRCGELVAIDLYLPKPSRWGHYWTEG